MGGKDRHSVGRGNLSVFEQQRDQPSSCGGLLSKMHGQGRDLGSAVGLSSLGSGGH